MKRRPLTLTDSNWITIELDQLHSLHLHHFIFVIRIDCFANSKFVAAIQLRVQCVDDTRYPAIPSEREAIVATIKPFVLCRILPREEATELSLPREELRIGKGSGRRK